MHGFRIVRGVAARDVVLLIVDSARSAAARRVVTVQRDRFERPARGQAAHLDLGHGAEQVDGSQIGEHSRREGHLFAGFDPIHRDQPLGGEYERGVVGILAGRGGTKLLDGRPALFRRSGVGRPVRKGDDFELRRKSPVGFSDHFVDLRTVGVVAGGRKLHGLERGQVSVLRIEKEESVISVFEVDPVLEFALRAVVVRSLPAFRPPACRSCAERDAEAYPHVVRPLRDGSGDRFFMSGPAARHERRAGERRETDENAYDSVR